MRTGIKEGKMKKFLKIAGIICLAVLIWIVVIGGMLFLFSKRAKKNIDEMTKDMEINTTDTDKDKPEITVNITKTPSSGEQDASDDDYYDTMQEALLNATINLEPEEQYRRNIDEVIKEFESNEYAMLVYRSVKDKKEETLNFAYFCLRNNKVENKQYQVQSMTGSTFKYNSIFMTDSANELIESALWASGVKNIGVYPEKERFIYGVIRESAFKEGESIYYLKIEGEHPDEIIECEFFRKKWYFWYYNDLQSDKPYNELKITLKE